ncbi:MAG: hypothetical protein QXD51_03660, partial [Candidatus Anstonellales archaeon]
AERTDIADIEKIINETVSEVEKEMLKESKDGSRRRRRHDGEFQDWRTAFFGEPRYKCDGSPKAERRA